MYAALDTETTGVDAQNDRIVELSLWILDDQLTTRRQWTQRINPEMPIPAEASVVNGIYDADVAECPTFREIAPRIQRILKGKTIVAYNGWRFDVPLLHHELTGAGCPGLKPDHPVIDPYLLFIQQAPRTLSGAAQFYLGEDHTDAHAAEADVAMMLRILQVQLLRQGPDATLEAALAPSNRITWDNSIKADADGHLRFNFGKHRNQRLSDQPEYLAWMLRNDFPDDVKAVVSSALTAVPGTD